MIKAEGYAAEKPNQALKPYHFERRDLGVGDVLIEIKYCGICHSDVHQIRGEWGPGNFPMVPGHEIVGHVVKVGAKVSRFKAGDPVGVGCLVNSCRDCAECKEGLEQYCRRGAIFTYNSKDRDGSITQGGYSTRVVVDENFVLRVPDNLSLQGAAPLLCAGITTYSPLRHWKVGQGSRVGVIGLGGLGHMGVKIAKAMGAQVTVFSQTEKKKSDAMRLGADHFYATQNPDIFDKLSESFDVILNTVSAGLDWNQYMRLLARDGALVILGVPDRAPEIQAMGLIGRRRKLSGSLIGGIPETQEMLDFCGKHNIVSEIELIPMEKVNEAFDRVVKSDVRFRFVIDLNSLRKN